MDFLKFTGLDTNRNKTLLNDNDKLKKKMNEKRGKISSLEIDLNNLDIKNERLQMENKTLENECKTLENECKFLETKNNQISDDYEKLEKDNLNIVNENKLLVTDLENYQIKTTDLQKTIDIYKLKETKDFNKISSINDSHLEEVKNLNNINNTFKLELENVSNSFQVLEKTNVIFEEKIIDLENESIDNLKNTKKLQTRIKTLETQKNRLNNKNHKLLEQMQKHNFDVIEKLSEENINNKTYLEELICTISELISKNKNVKNIKNKK